MVLFRRNRANKIHVGGNDAVTHKQDLTAIVPDDKDEAFDHHANKQRAIKNQLDSQAQQVATAFNSNSSLQSNHRRSDSRASTNEPLKRASTFGRMTQELQKFFSSAKFEDTISESSITEDSEETICEAPVNPMQALLGTVSNNAYVSWTHLSKIIQAMEVMSEDFDSNTSQMNKIMLQQCLALLKNSPYVLKSKNDKSLEHKAAQFYKKSETDEQGNMVIGKQEEITKSRRNSLEAINQLRQQVVAFNALPHGFAHNEIENYIANMVSLHMDRALLVFSEGNGVITNNQTRTSTVDNTGNGDAETSDVEESSDRSAKSLKSTNSAVSSRAHTTNKTKIAIDISISNEISDKIVKCLSNVHSWNDFNIFELFDLAGHMSLPILTTYILKEYNLIHKLQLNESKLLNYFQCIQQVYNTEVPYHNEVHGADVLATSYQIIKSRNKNMLQLQNEELFSLFVASAVHDVGHNGFNNDFHIKTQSNLALLYNDNSVLENFHAATSWKLLNLKENNFFDNDNQNSENVNSNKKLIRKLITDIVLHTDMALHGKVVTSLQNIVETHKLGGEIKSQIETQTIAELSENERRTLMLGIVHAADISNPAKKFDFMMEWTNRLYNEFWKQGDKERELGFKVSPLCDRENPIVEKSAVGFGKFVVYPMLQKMKPLFSVMNEAIVEFDKNIQYWEKQLQQLNN